MQRPQNLWEQLIGKARAEGARGMGIWPLQVNPCDLEPPWEPFEREGLSRWDAVFNGWEAPWEGLLWKRLLFPPTPLATDGPSLVLPTVAHGETSELAHIVVEQFPEDSSTISKADVFLRSLSNTSTPVSFEILGLGSQPQLDREKACELLAAGQSDRMSEAICGWTEPYVKTQFVAQQRDAKQVAHQLLGQYPNSAVLAAENTEFEEEDWTITTDIRDADGFGSTLGLRHPYCQCLRLFTKLDPDPLGVILAAMDHVGRREWALLQILFQPVTQPWGETLREAFANPYDRGKLWFPDVTPRMLDEKFSTPLFAVSIRITAATREIYNHMTGWAEQFSTPPQGFDYLLEDEEAELLAEAVEYRCTFRPGMLLNIAELASLVHLPGESIVSDRLKRVKTRTRAAVDAKVLDGSVLLGDNVHRGVTKPARISADMRPRHCYIAGASGTGKSTLLLNMILQDITAGKGVGVLDPHGDLINDVLCRIPEERINDVVLFDPTDDQFPVALNILEARDETERERIVAETVMSLERYFPSSWGPRLERILTFALYTVLDAIPGATLADVERILTDKDYREEVVLKTKDIRYVDFWNKQFFFMQKNAVDPVLNKLSVFLLNRTVRNIICQRHSAIDFDSVLNDGKILLANLSTGRLTEKIAGTLGSFLVTKIVNAAFRRSNLPESRRRPWYLYVDEFQAFMNLSVGFERILAESRKYNLVLAGMANQYVGQITPTVRQAIFGNVGTMIVFRLGVDDAHTISKELGAFTAEEVLNLEVGQAFVRSGMSASTFNLQSYPKPVPAGLDPTPRIQAMTRTHYASPIEIVEAELGPALTKGRLQTLDDGRSAEPEDPSEDDLVV
ncbi:MAG: ATP-binding protein [Planctomycetes bacterium]|nr:ATP-binding protein [Planctomycetota bacterium]